MLKNGTSSALLLACILTLPVLSIAEGVDAYQQISPFSVVGDAEFLAWAAGHTILGSGTASDPYIIQGFEIDAGSGSGMDIRSLSFHVVIRDNIFHNGGRGYDAPIRYEYGPSLVVADNTFLDGAYTQIRVTFTERVEVVGNTFTAAPGNLNGSAFCASGVHHVLFAENDVEGHYQAAVCSGAARGGTAEVRDNKFTNVRYVVSTNRPFAGADPADWNHFDIHHNEISYDGTRGKGAAFAIRFADGFRIENNTMTGISSRHGLAFLDSSYNHGVRDLIIRNNTIQGRTGIHIGGPEGGHRIEDNVMQGGYAGVWLQEDRNILVRDNVFLDVARPLDLYDSDQVGFTRNIVHGQGGLLHLERSNATLYDNIFIDVATAVDDESQVAWNVDPAPGANVVGGPARGGNLWSDHGGVDADGDGFTDLPHSSGDVLPLVPWTGAVPQHAPVLVQGDDELDALAAFNGWPGTGTATDPYRLEARTTRANVLPAVTLRDTTAHVRIDGLKVTGGSDPIAPLAPVAGVRLDNAAHVMLDGITAADNLAGIEATGVRGLRVSSLTNTGEGTAMFVADADDVQVLGASVTGSTTALNATDVRGLEVFDTIIKDGSSGLRLDAVSGLHLSRTVLDGMALGMDLSEVTGLVYDNRFEATLNARTGDGLDIQWHVPQRMGPNIVDGPFIAGNHWNDYRGLDVDGDRIGEVPHEPVEDGVSKGVPVVGPTYHGLYPYRVYDEAPLVLAGVL